MSTNPPRTTMVYCPPCMKHWAAPANKDYWKSRVELCPEHQEEADDDEFGRIPCSRCGKPTTWDSTYNDLCYRCIRADNE